MMKYNLYFLLCACFLASCDLLSPGETANPNVVQSDFANSRGAMTEWVNGINAEFAVAVSSFAEITGLLSDDMLNTSSRSSKTYDVLDIHYTDVEVTRLSTHIGKMIQMTEFGLGTLRSIDLTTTSAQLFNLSYIRVYAYLLAAENFVALPRSAHGEVLEADGLLAAALAELDRTASYATSATDQALVHLLRARALMDGGQTTLAAEQAALALAADEAIVCQTTYDALNGFANTVQEYLASGLFAILPTLSAQVAKFPMSDYFNQPICFAKAEEAHLILAQAALAEGSITQAQQHLLDLVALVSERRPASVSILTVGAADVEAATTMHDLAVVLWQMRQEIFFGEARRSSDLGIRLPMSEVEYNEYHHLPEAYKLPVVPAWLRSISTEIDAHTDLNSLMVSEK